MALTITQACIGCFACKEVCPNKAVSKADKQFVIAAHRCDECKANPNGPQCAQICPVETAITDQQGIAFNPPGSLTGLPQAPNVVAFIE